MEAVGMRALKLGVETCTNAGRSVAGRRSRASAPYSPMSIGMFSPSSQRGRCRDADQRRTVLAADVVECDVQVPATAKDRCVSEKFVEAMSTGSRKCEMR